MTRGADIACGVGRRNPFAGFNAIERHWRIAAADVARNPLFFPPAGLLESMMRRIASVLARPPESIRHLTSGLRRRLIARGVTFRVRKKSPPEGWRFLCGASLVRRSGAISIDVSSFAPLRPWNPGAFMNECLGLLAHESIHLAQRSAIGPAQYARRLSGHDCAHYYLACLGRPPAARHKRRAMRLYLSDPFEMQAHAFDLAREWRLAHPAGRGLRQRQAAPTPTWLKFRNSGFRTDGSVMSALLALAARYAASDEMTNVFPPACQSIRRGSMFRRQRYPLQSKRGSTMVDLGDLNKRLSSDKALQEEFMNDPVKLLQREGLELAPDMQKQLRDFVADSKKSKKTVPGATLGVQGGGGVGISIRISGGSGMLHPQS
jgi:hypothetical protein